VSGDRQTPYARELTRNERAAIRRLVVGGCANYDSEYCCLPLDYGRCYMLDKRWTGGYCKYFRNAVLPLDPVLEASLTGKQAPEQDICAVCDGIFIPKKRQRYCSSVCRGKAQRRQQREHMRKKRGKC